MTIKKHLLGYVGTYTKRSSEGIYAFTLNTETGGITNIHCVAKVENPTYLTISENKQSLYSVVKENDLGGIAAFSILENGALQFLNQVLVEGAPPCHVSTGNNHHLLSANYHKGTVDLYPINIDGQIQPSVTTIQHEGSGPDSRQEKAHTHYACFTPGKKFVVAIDLGMDTIFTYELKKGKLIENSRLACKPGSGPRHLVFHPNKQYAYVMTEFSSEVIVLKYNANTGSFTHVQSVSAIPASFTDNNQGSAIHITKDGKFIYAANRGHDSIALFQVNEETFELNFVEHASTEGKWPRDFSLDPLEQFLIASNQNSDNLVLFARNSASGKLTLIQSDITLPEPVCVKFLDV